MVTSAPFEDVCDAVHVLMAKLRRRNFPLALGAHIFLPQPCAEPEGHQYRRKTVLAGVPFWALSESVNACGHRIGTCKCHMPLQDENTLYLVLAQHSVDHSVMEFAAKHQCGVVARLPALPLPSDPAGVEEGASGLCGGDEAAGVAPVPYLSWKRTNGAHPVVEFTHWGQTWVSHDVQRIASRGLEIHAVGGIYGARLLYQNAPTSVNPSALFLLAPGSHADDVLVTDALRKAVEKAIARFPLRPSDDDVGRLVRLIMSEGNVDSRTAFNTMKQMLREAHPTRVAYSGIAFSNYVDSTSEQVQFFLSMLQAAGLCAAVGVTVAACAPLSLLTLPIIVGAAVGATGLGIGAAVLAHSLTPAVIVKSMRQASWKTHAQVMGRLFSFSGWCALASELSGAGAHTRR